MFESLSDKWRKRLAFGCLFFLYSGCLLSQRVEVYKLTYPREPYRSLFLLDGKNRLYTEWSDSGTFGTYSNENDSTLLLSPLFESRGNLPAKFKILPCPPQKASPQRYSFVVRQYIVKNNSYLKPTDSIQEYAFKHYLSGVYCILDNGDLWRTSMREEEILIRKNFIRIKGSIDSLPANAKYIGLFPAAFMERSVGSDAVRATDTITINTNSCFYYTRPLEISRQDRCFEVETFFLNYHLMSLLGYRFHGTTFPLVFSEDKQKMVISPEQPPHPLHFERLDKSSLLPEQALFLKSLSDIVRLKQRFQ